MSKRMDTPENIRIKVAQELQRMLEHNMKEFATLKEWMPEQCKKTFVEIQELKSQNWKIYQEKIRRLEPHGSTETKGKELCYDCKKPWESDHRCRGKGKVHYVEVHYDNEDEEDACDEDDRWTTRDTPSIELSSQVSTHVG
jgi:hypothetical protein